jgi:hypothetical protein
VLAGASAGQLETSPNVFIDPIEPLVPKIAFINCTQNDSIAFNWTHNPRDCYNGNIRYIVSWGNIDDNTTGDAETISKNYTIQLPEGTPPNSNYSITVRTRVRKVESSCASQNVATGQPQATCYNREVCYNRNFTLFCEISTMHVDDYSNIYWTFNSKNISGYTPYNTSSDGRQLLIRNVTAERIGEYGCCIVLNGTTFIEGMTYNVTALDSPKKPTISTVIPEGNSVNVSWQHEDSCFEDHIFHFKVTWYSTMSGNSSQMSAAVNETSYLIRGLTPCTEYTIFVSAVSTSSPSVQSDKTRATTNLNCTSSEDTTQTSLTALAALAAVLVLLILVVLAVVVVICVLRKRSKSGDKNLSSKPHAQGNEIKAIKERDAEEVEKRSNSAVTPSGPRDIHFQSDDNSVHVEESSRKTHDGKGGIGSTREETKAKDLKTIEHAQTHTEKKNTSGDNFKGPGISYKSNDSVDSETNL